MTKIIIEESITSTIKTGVGQHTQMLNALLKTTEYNYEIVSNKFIMKIKNATIKRLVFLFWLNTIFFLKLLCQKHNTIVIYTSFLPCIKLPNIKQIGIIHDVLLKKYPKKMSFLSHLNNQCLNFLIKNNADKILTVSETVKKEIIDYYKIAREKIFVVYNSMSLDNKINLKEDEILKKYNLQNQKNKYLLSVSSMNPNKNIGMLLEAFDFISEKYSNLKLVLTGGKTNIIEKYKMSSKNQNIIFTGFLSQDELKIIYKYAFCYIFPSVYEGFGIPIIDAQQFNIPVICSDIPVFREVAANSVLYSKITPESYMKSVEKLQTDQSYYKELINKGKSNYKRFSLENITKQFQKLLEG